MNKLNKNIIEAGVTSAEFDALFAGDLTPAEYLAEFPSQAHRYGHLADLAVNRGEWELADYFRGVSGRPEIIDFCD